MISLFLSLVVFSSLNKCAKTLFQKVRPTSSCHEVAPGIEEKTSAKSLTRKNKKSKSLNQKPTNLNSSKPRRVLKKSQLQSRPLTYQSRYKKLRRIAKDLIFVSTLTAKHLKNQPKTQLEIM